jgi:hypothetical protein
MSSFVPQLVDLSGNLSAFDSIVKSCSYELWSCHPIDMMMTSKGQYTHEKKGCAFMGALECRFHSVDCTILLPNIGSRVHRTGGSFEVLQVETAWMVITMVMLSQRSVPGERTFY